MNISRKDWHYKFIMKFGSTDARWAMASNSKQYTTCTYIQSLLFAMFNMFWFLFSVLCVIALGVFLLCSAAYTAFVFFSLGGSLPATPTLILVAGVMPWLVLLIYIAVYLLIKFLDLISKVSSSASKKVKAKKYQKSLAKQAVEDKKNGVCTLVKFVD